MSWRDWAARTLGVEVKDASTKRASQGPAYVFGGQGYQSNWDMERIVKDGFERVVWVYKGVTANAAKVASWPVRVMEGEEPDWRRVDDPLAKLLRSPRLQAVDGPANAFLIRGLIQLQLSKAGVFIEVLPNRAGGIAALYLLPAGKTTPIPDPDDFVSGFEVTHATGEREILLPFDPDKRRGVLWIKRPHPTDPYSSTTALEAGGISIDLDYYARLYNLNFMRNDGRSGQLVAVRGGLSPEDAQELKARFSPGMGGVGRTTVIEAEAISVQDTAVTPRDAQYAELRSITKEDCLIAVGTPETVAGNASGRTFDNADAEIENWLNTTCKDLAGVFGAGLSSLTEGGWTDDRAVWFDYTGEPTLRRSQQKREDQARMDFAAGLITADEFREVCGREPLERPGSRVLWVPGGKIAVGADEADEEAAGKLKPSGGGGAPLAVPGMAPDEAVAASRAGAVAGTGVAARRLALVKEDEPLAIEGKAMPETQKCKYCDVQAIERVIHAEGAAYVPVCGEHRHTAIRAVGGSTEIDGVQPIDAKSLKEPKQVSAASLRAGDVVTWGGAPYAVVAVKSRSGAVDIELVNAEGAAEVLRDLDKSATLTTVARRLHLLEAVEPLSDECWVGLG